MGRLQINEAENHNDPSDHIIIAHAITTSIKFLVKTEIIFCIFRKHLYLCGIINAIVKLENTPKKQETEKHKQYATGGRRAKQLLRPRYLEVTLSN